MAQARRRSKRLAAGAEVTGSTPLTLTHVGEPMLDDDTFAETAAPNGRGDELAEAMLQTLVLGDSDGSAGGGRHRALCTQAAAAADFRIEFHGRSRREGLGLPGRTGDREPTHVDVEVLLGKEGCVVACHPRFA